MTLIRAGFLPLLDAAIPIAAREAGFAEEHGIDLELHRETSWANIRDRVSVGQFDVAHMLAPMPVAANLGLSPLKVPLISPFALGLGGNAVTVSRNVWSRLLEHGANSGGDPHVAGKALLQLVQARGKSGLQPLTFAVVHDFSGHYYELCYWLAASGIDPRADIAMTIVPPSMMADALASGAIDGFCAGEPWNTVAAETAGGAIVTTKSAIWQSSPEKVLGMRKAWAEQNLEIVYRLLRALHAAALWCGDRTNADALTEMLAAERYIGAEAASIHAGITGTLRLGDAAPVRLGDFLMFDRRAANFPWQSHAMWFFSQMVRWGQVPLSAENVGAARMSYRPDIYRQALGSKGVALPGASSKIEGGLAEETFVPASGGSIALGPDGFFDGVIFDPDRIEDYVKHSPFYGALHNN